MGETRAGRGLLWGAKSGGERGRWAAVWPMAGPPCMCGGLRRAPVLAPLGASLAETYRCQTKTRQQRCRATAGWDVGLYPFLSHGW